MDKPSAHDAAKDVPSPKQLRAANPFIALLESHKWARAMEGRLDQFIIPEITEDDRKLYIVAADHTIDAMNKLKALI